MELPFLSQLVGWLRSGYPQGIPESDYLPLFALLSRRLSDAEVREIAETLVEQGVIPVDKADILVLITKVTDEMPREEDVERISALLEEHGWPVARHRSRQPGVKQFRPLPIPFGDRALSVLDALAAVLDGTGPALLPVPADDPRETARLTVALNPNEPIDDDVALVVATSGTTGIPKGAQLSAAALRASGTATHARLGGPGQWLLCLPAHHIAGVQVLLRSLLAETEPAVVDVAVGFDPDAFVATASKMSGPRRYTSMVPTQLVKALDHPGATAALREFDALLIGGAATPVPLRERAEAAGLPIVRTYGMSETCGGCVYDGVPLDGVRVRIGDDGRVLLGGPVLASGYRGLPDHPAFAEHGWFRTDDAGGLHDGVLSVLGRLDEAISTGGLTVVPQVVEAALASHPGVSECAVIGLPDERLGERVVAVVVPGPVAPTLDQLREHVRARLDAAAVPRALFLVDALPTRGPGKLDRAGLRARFSHG